MTWRVGGLVSSDHQITKSSIHELRPLQKFWHLRAFAQLDVGLLPVRPASGEPALPLDLSVRDARPDALDLGAEQLLDRAFDFDLVRAGRHLEHNRPAVFAQDRRLLGDERAADHVCQFHELSASCSFSRAPCVATTRPAPATSRAVRRALATSDTPGMLRTDRDSFSSAATSTRTALPVTPNRFSISTAALVLISVALSASTTMTSPAFIFSESAARSAPRSTFFDSLKS